jgi:glutamine cyclotransferase
MTRVFIITLLACLAGAACKSSGSKKSASNPSTRPAIFGYEVLHSWPHDQAAYTQGLIFHEGRLIEGTGQNGRSSLRRVELETGNVIQKVDVPTQYFGEGVTLFGGKIYQLTWQDGLGFIYDPVTFEKIGEFNYYGEGWGLTHDDDSLILSDGSNRLRFLDPQTFQVKKSLAVLDQGTPVRELNELEYMNGEILANVWHTDRIARIDPSTGKVIGWIDLTGLLPKGEVHNNEAVLNGIAYDSGNQRLFVTGKLWPKLFEIRVKAP